MSWLTWRLTSRKALLNIRFLFIYIILSIGVLIDVDVAKILTREMTAQHFLLLVSQSEASLPVLHPAGSDSRRIWVQSSPSTRLLLRILKVRYWERLWRPELHQHQHQWPWWRNPSSLQSTNLSNLRAVQGWGVARYLRPINLQASCVFSTS